MSNKAGEIQMPTLLFIKNQNHQFGPVEKFLSKRGYKVFVETDTTTGLEKILEINPDYIFLAWDHKNEGIRQMPKTIYQSCTGQIVPFIMSMQRDQIIQLESSGFENKLYPPLSGPAIQRAISKYEKKNQALDDLTKKANAPKKQSEMIQVKSFFKADEDNSPNINLGPQQQQAPENEERKILASRARNRLNTFQQTQTLDQESDLSVESGRKSKLLISKQSAKLSQSQMTYLTQTFDSAIKPEILETLEQFAHETPPNKQISETTIIYVMVIQELEWTGYLVIASESYLDLEASEAIFNSWVEQMILADKKVSDIDFNDSVFLEIQTPRLNFIDFCGYKAEFYKDIDYKGQKTAVGFFSFSPYEVINAVHDQFDYLELSTEFLQPDSPIPFDIHLYLKENKRFVLYLRPGSFLDEIQMQRLKQRSVEHIYTSMDYELALLKYKAEFNLLYLIKSYQKMKALPE